MINNLPKHIVRLFLLLCFLLVMALFAKSYLTDPSFYEYGHYRSEAVPELAAPEPVFKGSAYCLGCHEQRLTDWSNNAHVVVQCEVCHGTNREVCLNPGLEHLETSKSTIPSDTIKLCTTCHLALSSRPAQQPQIVLGQHPFPDEETPQCYTCHNPHSPSNRESPAEEATRALTVTEPLVELPEAVTKCAKCHGKRGQGRNKTPALAGMQAAIFVEQMNKYKSGNSDNKTMIKYASELSDEEITALARYYESLPIPAPD